MKLVEKKVDMDFLEQNLQALFTYIQRVRREIAALNHSGDGDDKFATMGKQLDGIVEATMDASHTIMDAVESNNDAVKKLQETARKRDQIALLNRITDNNNAIFEACAFQDLTGQRVSKIIKSVSYVEERIGALREIWGEHELSKVEIDPEEEPSADEKLMHGPQNKAEAISQAEIDRLFE